MPLLHAWSLSVEEQFYLIYPILLFLLVRLKFRRNALFWFTLAAALFSYAGFIYARRHFPDAGFFLGIFRAWELLAGCLLAIFRRSTPRAEAPMKLLDQWLPLAGIGLIIIGYLSGWGISAISYRNAFMTVLGTCLVIQFTGRNSRFAWSMLTLSPLVGIGLISYSLYLWHWPVIVFSRFAGLSSLALPFLLTGILAYASYRWVEKPLRFCTNQKFLRWFIPLFSVTLLSLLLPLAVKRSWGKYRIPEFSSSINLEPVAVKSWYGSYEGNFRTGLSLFNPEEGPADAIILGDSHSLMFFPAIRQSCESLGLRLAFFGADGGTSPFLMEEGVPAGDYGRGWTLEERRAFDAARLAFISQAKPRFVFVCARWDSYSWTEARLTTHLRRLKEACGSSHLIFLGQPPVLPFGSDGFTSGFLEKPVLRPFAEFPYTTDSRDKMHEILRRFCTNNPDSHFVSTEEYYLREGHLYFMDGETLFYKDDDHLSIDGSLRAVPAVDQILRSLQAPASNRVSK